MQMDKDLLVQTRDEKVKILAEVVWSVFVVLVKIQVAAFKTLLNFLKQCMKDRSSWWFNSYFLQV